MTRTLTTSTTCCPTRPTPTTTTPLLAVHAIRMEVRRPLQVVLLPRQLDAFVGHDLQRSVGCTCTGAATGYGVSGKTVIKIAAYQWTTLRLYIAQKLTALKGRVATSK